MPSLFNGGGIFYLSLFAFSVFSILPERRVCGWFIKAEKK